MDTKKWSSCLINGIQIIALVYKMSFDFMFFKWHVPWYSIIKIKSKKKNDLNTDKIRTYYLKSLRKMKNYKTDYTNLAQTLCLIVYFFIILYQSECLIYLTLSLIVITD